MVAFNHLLDAVGLGEDGADWEHRRHRADAAPNDTDGTIADEPASRKAASRAAEALAGRPLSEPEKDVGGPLMHFAFGAAAGAIYGALAETSPGITRGGGAPFGAGIFLTAGEVGVPLARLSKPPTAYPARRHLAALATHVVYGLTLEAVREGFRSKKSEVRSKK
jgi:hypothetical protein